jgi:hypothetical protein
MADLDVLFGDYRLDDNFLGILGQCDRKIGVVMFRNTVRVAPPNTSSRKRDRV